MGEVEVDLKDYVLHEVVQDCSALTSIAIIDKNDLNYKDFLKNFMLKNIPCLVKNVSNEWECSKKWISNNNINFDFLVNCYGDLEAPVADCNNMDFNSHCKINMRFEEYIDYYKSDIKEKVLYLKDWHLKRLVPNDLFYEVPCIFASDWLNEYALDHKEDDFMFVYIGPKTSWTPLHTDVYSSFSWSVNVIGQKKWLLFPPYEEEKLRDNLGNLPLSFHPDQCRNINYMEIIQETGDALFVPSKWYHEVINLRDTISINHNWINGCNIHVTWQSLLKTLSEVENEIKEFEYTPEYTSQCQTILKSLFGMNFEDFLKFVFHIGEKRIIQLNGENKILFNKFYLGKQHIIFDLNAIFKLLNSISTHPLFIISKEEVKHKLHDLKESIFHIVEIHK